MNDTIKELKQTINSQGGRFGTFSDNFFTFIRQAVGITHLYNIDSKLGPSFEDRLKKVELMLQRAEFDDEKLDSGEGALAKYSDEAIELSLIVKKLGLQKDVCNKDYLTRFFKTFYLKSAGIEKLDEGLLAFKNLQVLNLSGNKITALDYISPNLEQLSLTANRISKVSIPRTESLIHLGLAYNLIDDGTLAQICQAFPNLFSLDLAFNDVENLDHLINCLKLIPKIKMLNLKGNPVTLTKFYRPILKQRFNTIKILDGTPAFTETEQALMDKKKKKFDAYGNEIKDLTGEIPVEKEVTFELGLRLLQFVQGVYLTQEMCPADFDLNGLKAEMKSSVFMLKYKDHFGKEVCSAQKVWINDFQVDKESGNGKTDFKYNIKIQLSNGPTVALRDWLLNDVFIELHHSKPKINERKADDDSIIKEVVLKNGQPEIVHTVVGLLRLETSSILNRSELTDAQTNFHLHMYFYDATMSQIPEYMFTNSLIKLKEADLAILVESLKEREDAAKAAADAKNASVQAPVPTGKGGKPDPKAAAAKAKPEAKKGAPILEDPNSPKDVAIDFPADVKVQPNYIIVDKSYTSMREIAQPSVSSTKAKLDPTIDKKALRTKELISKYNIIRSLPSSVAVQLRLNYVPPPVVEVVEPVIVAPIVASKAPAKKK